MGISKRNSRKISVDGQYYRWSPSQDSGYIVLVVQAISGKGKKLEVVISDSQYVVIENGTYSMQVGSDNITIITPKLVEVMIRQSIKLGWKPNDVGPPVELIVNGTDLKIRRGL